MIHKIYFDGSSALKMICIYDKSNNITKTDEVVEARTNNELEYLALLSAVKYANARYNNISKVLFLGDSELIIRHMTGEYKVTKVHLKQLRNKIVEEFKKKNIIDIESNFKWIPRNENQAGVILEKLLYKKKAKND